MNGMDEYMVPFRKLHSQTVEEHMQLSFSHIMKHWKRNPNQVGTVKTPGSRNVLLRFYPPQAALGESSGLLFETATVY